MDANKDYYSVLGVLSSIEQSALRAVYLALLKRFHPNIFQGDRELAEQKTKDINEAYKIIGNEVTRRDYDNARHIKINNDGDFNQTPDNSDNDRIVDSEFQSDWTTTINFYPNCEQLRIELEKISKSLSFLFQVLILSKKAAESSVEIFETLKAEYLRRYFGENFQIQEFALKQLNAGRRDVAIEINNAIRIIGTPNANNVENFISQIKKKFSLSEETTVISSSFNLFSYLLLSLFALFGVFIIGSFLIMALFEIF